MNYSPVWINAIASILNLIFFIIAFNKVNLILSMISAFAGLVFFIKIKTHNKKLSRSSNG